MLGATDMVSARLRVFLTINLITLRDLTKSYFVVQNVLWINDIFRDYARLARCHVRKSPAIRFIL